MRLQANAASLGRSDEDIVNQYRMGLDQAVRAGSSVAANVRSETRRCVTTAEINKERASNPHLHEQALLATRAPTTRTSTTLATAPSTTSPGTTNEGTVLLNKPLRQAYDIARATKCVIAQGGPDGVPPVVPIPAFGAPPVVWSKCVFCHVLKITLIPFNAENPLPGAGKANQHNPWRCPRAERAADQFVTEHPAVKREDFLRPIDNLSHQLCLECISSAQL